MIPDPAQAARSTLDIRSGGYFFAFLILGASRGILGPALPELAYNTGVQLTAISYLFSINAIGNIASDLFGARLYDRLPGHVLLLGTTLLAGILLFATPFIASLTVLIVLILLSGICQGLIESGGSALTVWIYKNKSGPYLNINYFSSGLGSFMAPVLIGLSILHSGTARWAFFGAALLALPGAALMAWLPGPQPPTRKRTNREQPAVSRLPWGLIAVIMFFLFINIGIDVGFGGWVYTYAITLELADKVSAAYLTSAYFIALTLGRLFGIPLAARFRPTTIILADLLGGLLSIALILIRMDSPTFLWIGSIGLGLSMASVFPTCLALAEQRMAVSGKITGWFMMGGSIGAMILPWIIGQMFESIGPVVVNIVVAIALLAGLAVYFFFFVVSVRLPSAA